MNYLQDPQPKVKPYILNRSKEINFPIPVLDSCLPWTRLSGIYVGASVILEKTEDATVLLYQGSFGKPIFPKAWPSTEKISVIRKRQWKRRKECQSKMAKINSKSDYQRDILLNNDKGCCQSLGSTNLRRRKSETNSNTQPNENKITENINSNIAMQIETDVSGEIIKTKPKENGFTSDHNSQNVIVINNSDEECPDDNTYVSQLNPVLCSEPIKTVEQTLYLTLEEAFFLSFALHCLTIRHISKNEALSLDALWELFVKADCNFVEKYVTYHYFRSKGWIVKSGLNFGCDFAIYKRGPVFYHASCLVKIKNINHPNKPKLSWEHLMGYCRVSEAAKKDFVLCEVTWPKSSTEAKCDIKEIRKFSVTHKLLQRWAASEHRVAP